MSRIPIHTVENAPEASRPIFEKIVQSTPGGRPANLHAQMAHSPAVIIAYNSLRAALAEQKSFDAKVGAARIATRLALMNGWTDAQVEAFAKGSPTSDTKIVP